MNPAPEFVGIQLENSILCKHNKIAGRVETILCEAEPIRLNDISHLKRLGPEQSAYERCLECRQYVCTCLWDKHVHVRPNEKRYSGSGIPKAKLHPHVSGIPFKVRKWNSNYGSTFSTQMAWVKRPVAKMCFTDSENEPTKEERQSKQTKATKSPTTKKKLDRITPRLKEENSLSSLETMYRNPECLQTPGKVDNKDWMKLRKEYFDERSKMLAEQKKLSQNNSKGKCAYFTKKSKPNLMINKQKLNYKLEMPQFAKCSKNANVYSGIAQDLSMNVNMTMTVAPMQVPPKSPEATQIFGEQQENDCKSHSYVHRVTEIIHSRSMFGNQAQCSCHTSVANSPRMSRLMKMSDSFAYPSRFNIRKPDGRTCRRKASDFLFKYQEAGVSRPACTIDSLENLESKANETNIKEPQKKLIPKTVEKSAYYGDLKLLEETLNSKLDKQFKNSAAGSNVESRIAHERGEKKIMKNIAVQTEESSFSIPILIKAQLMNKCDLVTIDGDADERKEFHNNKTVATETTQQNSELNLNNSLIQELVCEIASEILRKSSRVKEIAALFESRSKECNNVNYRTKSLSHMNFQNNLNENKKTFSSVTFLNTKSSSNKIKQTETIKSKNNQVTLRIPLCDTVVLKDDFDSSSSRKSDSEISITTVVINPMKRENHKVKSLQSKDMNVFEAYE